jgi:hypothetical protein
MSALEGEVMRNLVLSFLFLTAASPSFAGGGPTLNGSWEGSYSCKFEDSSGKGSFKVSPSFLAISQGAIGGPMIVNISDGMSSVPYSGTTVPSAASSSEGAGAWIACGTSDATTGGLFNEIETFHYKVDANGGGTIKKSGAYVTNGEETGVCKGSWKRVSTGPVKVVGCAP